jgi:Tfp pilus assembly protein PilO
VSDRPQTSLTRRIVDEHRRVIVPLVAALIVNVLAYAFIVYPLSRRVANVAQRTENADQALAAATREYTLARGTLTGKDVAAKELTTFYTSVLPTDVASARRLTHLRLAQLARQSNLRLDRANTETAKKRDSTLTEFKVEMELEGSYDGVRTFVYRIETAPEFVIIKHEELSEGDDNAGRELKVKLELATYFRDTGQ